MKIEVSEGQEFEVITGEAPGIPPGNGSVLQNMIHLFAIL